jgi:hypothetical protein
MLIMRSRSVLFLLLLGWMAVTPTVSTGNALNAESPAVPVEDPDSSKWNFNLRPYFFLSGISGSVTVPPTFPLNSRFSDLLKHVKLGAFINFTAQKGQWGASGDFQYINLYGEGSGLLDMSLDLKNVIGEVDVFYQPDTAPTLRFLAGVRSYSVNQIVTIEGNELPAASTVVVDPILGAYGVWKLSDRWDFELRGDIGGFGASSEFTYQMMALFHWDINESLAIPFGYRVLGYQINQDNILMDTRMAGMVLGLDIRF